MQVEKAASAHTDSSLPWILTDRSLDAKSTLDSPTGHLALIFPLSLSDFSLIVISLPFNARPSGVLLVYSVGRPEKCYFSAPQITWHHYHRRRGRHMHFIPEPSIIAGTCPGLYFCDASRLIPHKCWIRTPEGMQRLKKLWRLISMKCLRYDVIRIRIQKSIHNIFQLWKCMQVCESFYCAWRHIEKLEEKNTQTLKNYICLRLEWFYFFPYTFAIIYRYLLLLYDKKKFFFLFRELDIQRSFPDIHKLFFLILFPGNSVDYWNALRAKLFVKFTLKNIRGNPELKSLKEKSFAHSGLV